MQIKRLYEIDGDVLKQFLYAAIFQPDPLDIIPFSVVESSDLSQYIDQLFSKKGDYAIGAIDGEALVGLVWVRLVKGYGHVDASTPELNISVLDGYRGRKLGSRLIKTMLALLSEEGFKQVSLSVQKANRAVKLYEELGFTVFAEDEETYTMVYGL